METLLNSFSYGSCEWSYVFFEVVIYLV